jgi:DMSO/TMAO reductase YedYZ molybdopterin-dependent catalytic subunit
MKDTQKHYTGDEIKKARQSSSMGLIIRQKEPSNLETPFDQVDSFLTPTELFYIRSHFPAPKLNLASYQLRIDGAVRNPLSLSYQELRIPTIAVRRMINASPAMLPNFWPGIRRP